jgi:hypothetical protein
MSGLSPGARALVVRARPAEEPKPGDDERVAAAVAAALGAGTVGAAFGRALPTTWAPGIAAKIMVAIALTVGTGALVLAGGHSEIGLAAPREAAAIFGAGERIAPVTSQLVAPPPAAVETAPAQPTNAVRAASAPRAAPLASSVGGRRVEAPASSLRDEAALLRRAQEALQQGDSGAALEALDEHARLHPAGILGPERDAARAVALCKAGRGADGRALGAAFLAAHPGSPLAQRVRDACGL